MEERGEVERRESRQRADCNSACESILVAQAPDGAKQKNEIRDHELQPHQQSRDAALDETYASKGATSGCASGRTRSIASFSNQTTNAIFHARSAPLVE